ncbi:bacteriophage abortive infection AbiH family protein [Ferribacterium limneticum]|uniref:bacteriophage abortive infection AbiH family protein n=1 Tax=Ferribacterium limneticum TaxID=76259 RepID=UPI001CFB262A|nr:bacteriophage abortive infection AbiH family protein [Ferribacterium limneticum]UCV19533.1 bacteriophage abortive infection AbiH family protein [Ferribacterium limneticum]
MKNRHLYIIGNGFDLWHGIPSRYREFKSYLEEHDRDLLHTVEDYLPAGKDWSDLESSLAGIDVDRIIDDLGHFMSSYGADDWSDSGHNDFQYEVERTVQMLSSELRKQFAAWIRQLSIPTPMTAPQCLKTINSAANFLSFNYTSTLQILYGVADDRILHIHGRSDIHDSDLILGHAWNPMERRSLNDRNDIEDIDTRLMEAHDILDEYFANTFKPSTRLIQDYRSFFEQQAEIQIVSVLGHSLMPVDAPYFAALLAGGKLTDAQWQLAVLPEDDLEERISLLQDLGVNETKITTIFWSEI